LRRGCDRRLPAHQSHDAYSERDNDEDNLPANLHENLTCVAAALNHIARARVLPAQAWFCPQ
jgi:hypothetical protein